MPGFALPWLVEEPATALNQTPSPRGCGPVQKFFDQTPRDWVDHDTDKWLDDWFQKHHDDIEANRVGFAGAFGRYALEDPDWSCLDVGSDSNCDFNPCHNITLNGNEDEIRPAYYFLEALRRLHEYHTGVAEAFSVSMNYAALNLATWVPTFYKDQEVRPGTVIKEILNAFSTVFGVAAAVASFGGAEVSAPAGVINALFAGFSGAVSPLLGLQ